MLQVIERCFSNQLDHGGWIDTLRKMIPSYGESLIANTDLCKKVRADTAVALNIVNL
jgi:malate dehydrogenase (quinone)